MYVYIWICVYNVRIVISYIRYAQYFLISPSSILYAGVHDRQRDSATEGWIGKSYRFSSRSTHRPPCYSMPPKPVSTRRSTRTQCEIWMWIWSRIFLCAKPKRREKCAKKCHTQRELQRIASLEQRNIFHQSRIQRRLCYRLWQRPTGQLCI